MKLLPEVPADLSGLISALKSQRQVDADGVECGVSRQAVDEAVAFLERVAAAPDVKDEHCGWCHFVEYEEYITALEFCDSDAIGAFKVYRHPSRRIAALEAEVVKLREALEEIRTFPRKRFPQDVANEALK